MHILETLRLQRAFRGNWLFTDLRRVHPKILKEISDKVFLSLSQTLITLQEFRVIHVVLEKTDF